MSDDLSQPQRRELQTDFWFEPPPTFEDSFWPVALAVTWIAWRDEAEALHHFEQLRVSGRSYWMRDGMAGRVTEPRDAEGLLLSALRAGSLSAFGLTDQGRYPVGRHEWIDLRLFGSSPDDKIENAIWKADGSVRFSDVRVVGAQVLSVWPRTDMPTVRTAVRKPPGPSREAWNAVYTMMMRFDLEELKAFKVESLPTVFGSNRESCRNVRIQVLTERNNNN